MLLHESLLFLAVRTLGLKDVLFELFLRLEDFTERRRGVQFLTLVRLLVLDLRLAVHLQRTTNIIIIIIIIIMTRRQLRSVAATPYDVHVHLHSATSVSSWPVFRCRSVVSKFFEDAQEVFSSLSPDSVRLSLQ